MPDRPSIEEKVARAIEEVLSDFAVAMPRNAIRQMARAALAALQGEGEKPKRWPSAAKGLDPDCAPRDESLDAAYHRAGTLDPLTPEDFTGAELETLGVLAEAGVEHGDWVPPVLEAWDSAKAKIVARLRALASTGRGTE